MRDMDELIMTEVAANWQGVALRMGVEIGVSKAILRNNPTDCEGACRDMLNRWLRKENNTGVEKRTWSTLLTALGRAGFVELERRLQRALPQSGLHVTFACTDRDNGAYNN